MKIAREVRVGNVIKVGNDLLLILKALFHKSTAGRRASAAEMKFKVRNLITKHTSDIAVEATEKVNDVILERKKSQLLYKSDSLYHFMDQKTFEQFELDQEQLGDNANFLKDNMDIDVLCYEDKPISVELPHTLEFRIEYTEPGLRGDTTGRAMKPATLETGYELQVPLFCNTGDIIKVDTRTGEYMERA